MTQQKPKRTRRANTTNTTLNDGLRNFIADLGTSNSRNQLSFSEAGFNPITRVRTKLEFMYRSQWLASSAVDIPAEDMTRAGITLLNIDSKDEAVIQQQLVRLGIWSSLCQCIKWARLYGGSIGHFIIDGQDPETELDPSTILPGSFKGITPYDRWQLDLSSAMTDVIHEQGENFGLPRFYKIFLDKILADPGFTIHHTRATRFTGIDLPYWQRISEMNFGMSVIERFYDQLVSFDSATLGMSQMAFKTHLRYIKVQGLREVIGMSGPVYNDMKAYFENLRFMQTNEGITILDKDDELEAIQYNFAGFADVLTQLALQRCGALQIPYTRLFGDSPSGLSATGESDLETYYENVHKQQEMRLRSVIHKIIECISWSALGKGLPENFDFTFNSLEQMNDVERVEIAEKTTHTIINAFTSGLVDRRTALEALQQSARVSGLFTNIDINTIMQGAENDIT